MDWIKENLKLEVLKEIFFDLGNNLPSILFFLVPFLYNDVNGYSLILCLPVACIFALLSSKHKFENCVKSFEIKIKL